MTNDQLNAVARTISDLLVGGLFTASVDGYADLLTKTIEASDVTVSGADVTVTAIFTYQVDLTLTAFTLYDRNGQVMATRQASIALTGNGEGAYISWTIQASESAQAT